MDVIAKSRILFFTTTKDMNEWMSNYINYDALTSNEIILCCYFSSTHDKKFSQILCL